MEQTKFEKLKEVIDTLRSENGCPWDRKQTYETLKPCLLNEMTEVFAAVDLMKEGEDGSNLCEEIGDVLMNLLLMIRIAEEEGRFTVDDVLGQITEKMIRRHPHVFGNDQVSDSDQVLVRWEEIKKQEKAGSDPNEKAREKEACRIAQHQMLEMLSQKA